MLCDTSFGTFARQCSTAPPVVARIALEGEPYVQERNGVQIDCTSALEELARSSSYAERVTEAISRNEENLLPLKSLGFRGLERLLKKNVALSFEEAFSAVSLISMASNDCLCAQLTASLGLPTCSPITLQLQAISLLQQLSMRESYVGLNANELAGMVGATLELDTISRITLGSNAKVFGMGGMGGDRGIEFNGETVKAFSLSTLTALTLSAHTPIHKHHSYPNTSKVGGQSAIEVLGARSDFDDTGAMEILLRDENLLMSSAHTMRTIHSISHLLKGETINHIIGPMSIPQGSKDKLQLLLGVNHNVHPQTAIRALSVLQERGIQCYGTSVAFCGIHPKYGQELLDEEQYYRSDKLKSAVRFDEVAPPPFSTLASFLTQDGIKTVIIEPADFLDESLLNNLKFENLLVSNNEKTILAANDGVINGTEKHKQVYLAMSVALALFASEYADKNDAFMEDSARVNRDYMRECLRQGLDLVTKIPEQLNRYVEATHRAVTRDSLITFSQGPKRLDLQGVDAVILDVDGTLAVPTDTVTYQEAFSSALERTLSNMLDITIEESKIVANHYRTHHGAGEAAFMDMDLPLVLAEHYPKITIKKMSFPLGFSNLYDEISDIPAARHFLTTDSAAQLITALHNAGKKIVVLTDAPEKLSRKVLEIFQLEPELEFDIYIPWKEGGAPPKFMGGEDMFRDIARQLGLPPDRVISVGDSLHRDVQQALSAGLQACLVDANGRIENSPVPVISNVMELLEELN